MRKLLDLIFGYLRPGLLGSIGSIVGIAGGLNSIFGGGSSPSSGYGSGVPYYVPQWQQGADQLWQQLMQGAGGMSSGIPGQTSGPLLQSLQEQLGINYDPLVQAGQQAGQQAGAAGQQVQGLGDAMSSGALALLNAGQDPRQALYQRTAGQLTDQINAAQALRGLGTSPVGGAEYNQAMSNFNIDWQNQQLQRMLQATQGAGGAASMASNLYSQAPLFTLASGQIPISAQQTAASAPGQAAVQYASGIGQSINPLIAQMQGLSQYLNYGAGQASGATQAYGNYANQVGQGMQGLGRSLSGLGNTQLGSWLNGLFSGGGGSADTGLGSIGGGWTSMGFNNPSAYISDSDGISDLGASLFADVGYCDRAAKCDIRPVGRTPGGLTVYRFRYRPAHRARYGAFEYTGVMADEVAERFPAAVCVIDGATHVRYSLIE